jgi:flagellar biosynthesis/type III secretory pathway chaperone
MEALEQVTLVMALMRQLEQVMEQEILVLRSMRLDRLADIVLEKTTLCHAYELELRALRCRPELLASLDAEIRLALEQATREFQARSASNLRALEAARSVVERVMRHIGSSLDAGPLKPRHYHPQQSNTPMRGQVIALAFDRQI